MQSRNYYGSENQNRFGENRNRRGSGRNGWDNQDQNRWDEDRNEYQNSFERPRGESRDSYLSDRSYDNSNYYNDQNRGYGRDDSDYRTEDQNDFRSRCESPYSQSGSRNFENNFRSQTMNRRDQDFPRYGQGLESYGASERPGFYGSDQDFNSFGRESDFNQSSRGMQGSNTGSRSLGGKFRGKGPKSFKRSDERITEDVCRCLEDHDELDASNIDVTVMNGEVTLKGTIEGRRDKRLAEEIVENIWGVKDVKNEIRVQSGSMRGQQDIGEKGSHSEKSSHSNESSNDSQPRKPKAA